MSTVERVLRELQDRSTPNPDGLSFAQRSALAPLTDRLATMYTEAEREHDRFMSVQHRGLLPAPEAVAETVRRSRVLITGGTGFIGTALIREILDLDPARVVSVARGVTMPRMPSASVEYLPGDVRDEAAMHVLMRRIKPDIVFHLAAVRDPGEAEHDPSAAITTNVLGTQSVVAAALGADVKHFVYASTGKAVRFYTRDVYAATKKVGEIIVARAGTQIGVGAARFTHVVDNSLIQMKLRTWMHQGGLILLHDPYLQIYAQSARESAQLLLAALPAEPGHPRLYTMRDLDLPFDLIDLALGMRTKCASNAAICFTGFAPGYESQSHSAQYDPRSRDEVGPLINTIEACRVRTARSETLNAIDLPAHLAEGLASHVADMERLVHRPWSAAAFQSALDAASVELVRGTMLTASEAELARLAKLAKIGSSDHPEHLIIDSALGPVLRRAAS